MGDYSLWLEPFDLLLPTKLVETGKYVQESTEFRSNPTHDDGQNLAKLNTSEQSIKINLTTPEIAINGNSLFEKIDVINDDLVGSANYNTGNRYYGRRGAISNSQPLDEGRLRYVTSTDQLIKEDSEHNGRSSNSRAGHRIGIVTNQSSISSTASDVTDDLGGFCDITDDVRDVHSQSSDSTSGGGKRNRRRPLRAILRRVARKERRRRQPEVTFIRLDSNTGTDSVPGSACVSRNVSAAINTHSALNNIDSTRRSYEMDSSRYAYVNNGLEMHRLDSGKVRTEAGASNPVVVFHVEKYNDDDDEAESIIEELAEIRTQTYGSRNRNLTNHTRSSSESETRFSIGTKSVGDENSNNSAETGFNSNESRILQEIQTKNSTEQTNIASSTDTGFNSVLAESTKTAAEFSAKTSTFSSKGTRLPRSQSAYTLPCRSPSTLTFEDETGEGRTRVSESRRERWLVKKAESIKAGSRRIVGSQHSSSQPAVSPEEVANPTLMALAAAATSVVATATAPASSAAAAAATSAAEERQVTIRIEDLLPPPLDERDVDLSLIFLPQMVLSCMAIWCCGCIMGLIGFVFSVFGSRRLVKDKKEEARKYEILSYVFSTIGVVCGFIVVIVFLVLTIIQYNKALAAAVDVV